MSIIEQLNAAAGKPKAEVPSDNIFGEIGFDGDNPRLGWVMPPSDEEVEKVLGELAGILAGKEEFIFVGIGGSGNGIKTLLSLKPDAPIHCLDSLDPEALKNIIANIKKPEKTLIIPISKSGSTAETQLLAKTLKAFFGDAWGDHFLWLSDTEAFAKLDAAGWGPAAKRTIQIDGHSDIGGRFTCPHTLIFLLPLFLILERDLPKVKALYRQYLMVRDILPEKAYQLARKYAGANPAFFSIIVPEVIKDAFRTWVTQLIQESLGSKKEGFGVKTVVETFTQEGFLPVALGISDENHFLYLMALMHFLQLFTAIYAAEKGINFVNQPCVESYKQTMRELLGQPAEIPPQVDMARLMDEIAAEITSGQSFIEIVLYCDPPQGLIEDMKNQLKETFPAKLPLIFLGSDWNHHSYQAAFGDTTTLYVILGRNEYTKDVPPFDAGTLDENIATLRRISEATYRTLQDHALYFSL